MKILIVHAHENPDSFCSALAGTAFNVMTKLGHKVLLSDLYRMGFNPVGSKRDFQKSSQDKHYKYAKEQLHNARNSSFSDDVQSEMDKLNNINLLIFNFPIWWYSMPAILKGWVDRIMAYGVAYGGEYKIGSEGRFKGAKAMCVVTTGSIKSESDDTEKILENVNEGIFEFVGFEALPSFIAYGVSQIGQQERAKILENYTTLLEQIDIQNKELS